MKKIFSRIFLIRIALAAAMVSIIMLVLPHTDHQSYIYELNQPWRYPLLTAPFDMPILRDSATITGMRDSIDRSFVPFMQRDNSVAENNMVRFRTLLAQHSGVDNVRLLSSLLEEVYSRGVVEATLYEQMQKRNNHTAHGGAGG